MPVRAVEEVGVSAADCFDDAAVEAVVLVARDSACGVVDLDKAVPGVPSEGVRIRRIRRLRNRRHVAVAIVSDRRGLWADDVGDVHDFVRFVVGAFLDQGVGGIVLVE